MHTKPLAIAYIMLCVYAGQAQQDVCQRRCNGSILRQPSGGGVDIAQYIVQVNIRSNRTINNLDSFTEFGPCKDLVHSKIQETSMPNAYPQTYACSLQENGNILCTFPKQKCHENRLRTPVDAILGVQLDQGDGYSYRRTTTSIIDQQQPLIIGTEGQSLNNNGCLVEVLCQSFHTLQIQSSASLRESQNYTFRFHVSLECTTTSRPCDVLPSMLSAKLLVHYGLDEECTSSRCLPT